MSTNNIGFYEDLTKIIFQLSSNTHFINIYTSVMDDFAAICIFLQKNRSCEITR